MGLERIDQGSDEFIGSGNKCLLFAPMQKAEQNPYAAFGSDAFEEGYSYKLFSSVGFALEDSLILWLWFDSITTYVLCDTTEESRYHFYFRCTFSKDVL